MSVHTVRKEWDTEFGHVIHGEIHDEERGVAVPFYHGEPHEIKDPSIVVGKTGLTADLESLKRLGVSAMKLGVGYLAVAHRHNDMEHPIRSNAMDVQAVINELAPEGVDIHGVGLSRGWAGMVLAAEHLPNRFSSLTAAAPAFMTSVCPSRFINAAPELVGEFIKNPRRFGAVVLDSVKTVVERPHITLAELANIVFGTNIHPRVERVASQEDMSMHLVACLKDCFYDPRDMSEVADSFFDTFTEITDGSAGHSAMAYDDGMTESIIATAVVSLPNREKYLKSKPTNQEREAA